MTPAPKPGAKVPIADRLRPKLNPHYDHDVDPSENEVAYVNPVALNNDLVKIANEAITITQTSVDAIKQSQRLKLDKKKLEREQDDAEEILLRDEPLSPSEAKSLKTIAAAVARRVKEQGKEQEFAERRKKIRELEDKIDIEEATIRSCSMYWGLIERVSDNTKTHLSYVKDEKRRAYAT